MSSRNERLSPATRDAASIIYKVLKSAKRLMLSKSPDQIIEVAMKKLKMPPIEPEYFSIVDGNLLTPVSDFNSSDYVVACVAVWADGVRLIDNLILKKS